MYFCTSVPSPALLGLCAAWFIIGGCASQPVEPPKEAPRVVVVADGGEPIKAAELDELTRAFADRYVGLLYSACDTVKKDNPDPVQRRDAQVLLLDCSTNIYDIASNADAFTRLLDLVVVTRLTGQVWVDDGRAAQVFGDRAKPLSDAMSHARAEAQTLAARVLTVEQVGALDTLLNDWRDENPGFVHASFVRFSNFAVGRGRSAASEVLAARGFFSEVGKAGQAVDEARLLGERMFYQLKREPTLLRWQSVAAKDDLLATPEVITALADVHRLTDQAEQLPANFAAERKAIVTAVDAHIASADATVVKLKDAIAEAKSLVESLDPASKSIDQMLTTADTLFARYDAWAHWAIATDPRPFRVAEYTEIVKESATTSQRFNEVLKSSGDLLASSEWDHRVDQWNRATDGRIEAAAGQGRLLLDDLFRRVYIALGVLFALLVGYRVFSYVLMRRLAAQGMPPGPPASREALGRANC